MKSNQAIAIVLVLYLGCSAVPLAAAEQLQLDDIRRLVNLFDVETEVRVRLTNNKNLEGAIRCFGPEGFILVYADGRLESVAYKDVAQIRTRNLSYLASAKQRGTTARSVAAGLGTGTVVEVKTASGGSLTGRIVDVRERSVVLETGKGLPVRVDYEQIKKLGMRKSQAQMVFIIVFILLFQSH